MTTNKTMNPPTALAKYVEASNAGDTAATVKLFSESAVVHDDGEEFRGIEAIQAWIAESSRKYQAQLVPVALEDSGNRTVLRGLVSGNFPGSPVELDFDFVLSDDKITHLAVN